MQKQPKPEPRGERVARARQARRNADDAFKGGHEHGGRLPLTKPWMLGTSRLWRGRETGLSEEN